MGGSRSGPIRLVNRGNHQIARIGEDLQVGSFRRGSLDQNLTGGQVEIGPSSFLAY